jgi:hypothetical protein
MVGRKAPTALTWTLSGRASALNSGVADEVAQQMTCGSATDASMSVLDVNRTSANSVPSSRASAAARSAERPTMVTSAIGRTASTART